MWPVPVLIAPPVSRVDKLLVGFIQECRRLAQMVSVDSILRPGKVNIRPLLESSPRTPAGKSPQLDLYRRHEARGSAHPERPNHPMVDLVTSLVDDVGMASAVDRLAAFTQVEHLMVWLSQPTGATFSMLRRNFHPRPSQITIPHPQWMDFILWARLRDFVIQRQDVYGGEDFMLQYASNAYLVNWQGSTADLFILDHDTGHMCLSDAFREYAVSVRNWRLGDPFFRRYPELRGFVEGEED